MLEESWDASSIAESQPKRPIVDILKDVAKSDFSKYKLAKAFIRWTKDHNLRDLQTHETEQAQQLVSKINKTLQ